MLPADIDERIIWGVFVISRYRDGQSVAAIICEARLRSLPMTRADALKILRRYVDCFDKDVRETMWERTAGSFSNGGYSTTR